VKSYRVTSSVQPGGFCFIFLFLRSNRLQCTKLFGDAAFFRPWGTPISSLLPGQFGPFQVQSKAFCTLVDTGAYFRSSVAWPGFLRLGLFGIPVDFQKLSALFTWPGKVLSLSLISLVNSIL